MSQEEIPEVIRLSGPEAAALRNLRARWNETVNEVVASRGKNIELVWRANFTQDGGAFLSVVTPPEPEETTESEPAGEPEAPVTE